MITKNKRQKKNITVNIKIRLILQEVCLYFWSYIYEHLKPIVHMYTKYHTNPCLLTRSAPGYHYFQLQRLSMYMIEEKCPSYDYSFGNLCPVKIHQRLMIGFNQNSEIRPYWYSWNLITAKTIAKPFFSNVEYLQLLSFSFRLKINTGSFNPLSWSNGIRTSPIPLSELSVLKIYKKYTS